MLDLDYELVDEHDMRTEVVLEKYVTGKWLVRDYGSSSLMVARQTTHWM